MKARKKILAVALDWGLGHATRMVPLLQKQVAAGASLVLAPTPEQEVIWREHFPEAEFINGIPAYGITFPEQGSLMWHLLRQWPSIRRTIQAEQQFVQSIAQQTNIDTIISDNRYGAFVRGVHNVLITHQLHLPLAQPWRMPAHEVMRMHMRPFQEIWVPDVETAPGLSGKLSHPTRDPRVKYIGPLSRLAPVAVAANEASPIVALVSGPEPHRSLFIQKLKACLAEVPHASVIVCGKPHEQLDEIVGNVRVVSHLGNEALARLLGEARLIICRSGYSTLMDLHVLGKQALLVPTTGQAEQEYLARHFSASFGWKTVKEAALSSAVIKELL